MVCLGMTMQTPEKGVPVKRILFCILIVLLVLFCHKMAQADDARVASELYEEASANYVIGSHEIALMFALEAFMVKEEPMACNMIGLCMVQLIGHENAIDWFKRCMYTISSPINEADLLGETLTNLAVSLAMTGEIEKGIVAIEHAIDLGYAPALDVNERITKQVLIKAMFE